MMIHAYNEIYLDDAMITLAELFSYVDNPKDADFLFESFIIRGIAHQFGKGNPRYLLLPSHVLFNETVEPYLKPIEPDPYNRSATYWCGYVLAYYQWFTGLSFEEIYHKLPPSKIIQMYNPLHEASLSKFVSVANEIVFGPETNLAKYRKAAGLSQRKLAYYSDVSIRSIQLYEQRRLNINLAEAIKLYQISRVLGCNMEDLLEKTENNKKRQ